MLKLTGIWTSQPWYKKQSHQESASNKQLPTFFVQILHVSIYFGECKTDVWSKTSCKTNHFMKIVLGRLKTQNFLTFRILYIKISSFFGSPGPWMGNTKTQGISGGEWILVLLSTTFRSKSTFWNQCLVAFMQIQVGFNIIFHQFNSLQILFLWYNTPRWILCRFHWSFVLCFFNRFHIVAPFACSWFLQNKNMLLNQWASIVNNICWELGWFNSFAWD